MDDQELNSVQIAALKQRLQETSQKRYLEISRKRLDTIVTKKMRTCFIGALAVFEEEFGFLWGYGKTEDKLSEQEQAMFQLWKQARTRVLNNSNNQLRAVKSEIANHVVSWNRYHLDLPVKPLGNTGEYDET